MSGEAACLTRFWTLRPPRTPVLRSDNGLISKAGGLGKPVGTIDCRRNSSRPPHWSRVRSLSGSFKEECVWQHTFQMFEEAHESFATGCIGMPSGIGARPIPFATRNPGG